MAWRKKTKKAAPIAQMSEEDVREIEEHVEELVRSQLPLGRVKKVVRMNPDVEMLNNEALQLMAKAAVRENRIFSSNFHYIFLISRSSSSRS